MDMDGWITRLSSYLHTIPEHDMDEKPSILLVSSSINKYVTAFESLNASTRKYLSMDSFPHENVETRSTLDEDNLLIL